MTPALAGKWGPFVLREQIGCGAFGAVCRAFDPAVDREVAVKLYASDELPAEPRLTARVRHLNVVTVFGAAVHEGRPGIWMELIHGRTLADRVAADGPLPPDEVVRIGITLGGALSAVHAARLIHQDVKAQNVMEENGGRIVLMDLGAGISCDDADAPVRVSGTPFYMAPEVVLGQRPSAETDVYSLGVLLFHLLTGTYPVCAPNIEELCRLHERQVRAGTRRFAVALRELNPKVSPALARCLARALAPSGQRYATAAELAEALTVATQGLAYALRRRFRIGVAVAVALVAGAAIDRWIASPPPVASVYLINHSTQ
jgi:eukaryotic-like serine/threonine-protein kinase